MRNVHYKFHELIYLFERINYDCLNQILCSPKRLKVEKMTSSGLYIRASSARSSSASLPGFRRLLSLLHGSEYVEEMDPQPSTFHKTPAT